jgi:transposase
MKRYIGMDIGSESVTIAVLEAESQNCTIKTLQKPAELERYLCRDTAIAAEWTGALAAKWLDEALKYTEHVYLYRTQGIRADKRVVGTAHKTDENDATALARILKIQSELGSPRFYPYRDLQETYKVRRIVYEAERYTREIARAKTILKNAELTGYQLPVDNEYLKTLQGLERQAWDKAETAIRENPATSQIYEVIKRLYPSSKHPACKIAACIAPIERWNSAAALRRYAGLYDQRGRTGKMTLRSKGLQGNKVLRTALVQLAVPAKFPNNRWNPLYKRMKERGLKPMQIAIRIATYMLNEIYREVNKKGQEGEKCEYCKRYYPYNELIPLLGGVWTCIQCLKTTTPDDYEYEDPEDDYDYEYEDPEDD